MDQTIISVRIKQFYESKPNQIKLVEIPKRCPRLDRSGFNFSEKSKISEYCDFHSFHANVLQKIPGLQKVFGQLFKKTTDSSLETIQAYMNNFVEIKEKLI